MNLLDLVLLAALLAVLVLAWRQQRWCRPVRLLWLPACAALWCLTHPPSWPFAQPVQDALQKWLPEKWFADAARVLRAGPQSEGENVAPAGGEALRSWRQWQDAEHPRLVGAGAPDVFWQHADVRAFDWQRPAISWVDAATQIQLGDAWTLRLRHSPRPTSAPIAESTTASTTEPTTAPRHAFVRQLRVRDRAGVVVAEVITDLPESDASATASTADSLANKDLQLTLVPRRAGLQMYLVEWLDAGGRLLGEQTLPLDVQAPHMLGVSGEFSAPSFEQRALREWLDAAGMDWRFHSRTGRDAQRQDQRQNSQQDPRQDPRQETPLPVQLRIIDARRWLDADARERALWLSETANGRGLVILADGSENDATQRQRLQDTLGMQWQAADAELIVLTEEGRLTLTRGSWQPLQGARAATVPDAMSTGTSTGTSTSTETARTRPVAATNAEVSAADLPGWLRARLWSRVEGKGRVVWWPLTDSHRLWQRAPAAYARSWQMLFAHVLPAQPPAPFFTPDAHWRVDRAARVCARERPAADAVQLLAAVDSAQTLSGWQWQIMQQAWCTTFWPRASGWVQLRTTESGALPVAIFAVLGRDDSMGLEAADNAAATTFAQAAFAHARADVALPMPRWFFLLVFLLLISTIWWVERRWPQA